MTHHRGVTYWETYEAAREVSRQYEGSRIVRYGRGWAVQLYRSGPYVDARPS